MSLRLVGAVAAIGLLLSCERPLAEPAPRTLALVAESDPGVRLGGVRVFVDGKAVGQTSELQPLQIQLGGQADRSLRIEHHCPPGYRTPQEPKSLRLWEFNAVRASTSTVLQVTLRCPPEQRIGVFVVRAEKGSNLPVMLDGKRVTETNASGVAHFSVSGVPGTEYTLRLDTAGQPRLVPRSPTYVFTLPDAHEIFVVNQTFELEREARRWRPPRKRIVKIE